MKWFDGPLIYNDITSTSNLLCILYDFILFFVINYPDSFILFIAIILKVYENILGILIQLVEEN